jgi:hypothetical protein
LMLRRHPMTVETRESAPSTGSARPGSTRCSARPSRRAPAAAPAAIANHVEADLDEQQPAVRPEADGRFRADAGRDHRPRQGG